MPTIFAPNALFLHVAKTGGTSVARAIESILPMPQLLVGPMIGSATDPQASHVRQHHDMPLEAAANLGERHGFNVRQMPLIMVGIRNPYALAVSKYCYNHRQGLVEATVGCDRVDLPGNPVRCLAPLPPALAQAIEDLGPGHRLRVQPDFGENPAALLRTLRLHAATNGIRLRAWLDETDVVVVPVSAPTPSVDRPPSFGEFLRDCLSDPERNFLSGARNRYELDGAVPRNLALLRTEQLEADLRDALGRVGLRPARVGHRRAHPHDPWPGFYDRETEALVWEHGQWLFRLGEYSRMPLDDLPAPAAHA